MFDATPILEALALLVAVIITAVVIPYIKARTTTQLEAENAELQKGKIEIPKKNMEV